MHCSAHGVSEIRGLKDLFPDIEASQGLVIPAAREAAVMEA